MQAPVSVLIGDRMKNYLFQRFGIGIFLIIISALFLFAGAIPNAVRIIDRRVSGEYELTTAVVLSVEEYRRAPTDSTQHDVTVKFIANGTRYEALLDTYVEGMKADDVIEIWYNTNDPSEITLKWNQPMQLVLFSVIAVLTGVPGVILMLKRKNKSKGG